MKLLTIILASLVSYVNPFIGTGYHGHTFPGAAWPFGMVQLSPDTRAANWHGTSGYHYSDSVILGFSHTHLSGTGISDWCDIRLMPIRNYPMPAEGDSTFRLDEARYRSSFSHDSEMASPGWYHVLLKDHMVSVDLTVGRRTGQHRYTYYTGLRSKGDPQVLIDLQPRDKLLDGNIIVDPKDPSVVYGFRRSSSWSKDQMVYFYIQFSSPVSSFAIGDGCAILNFAYVGTDVLEASVSISSTSADGARLNMITDEPMDFDTHRLLAAQEWESYLSTTPPCTATPTVPIAEWTGRSIRPTDSTATPFSPSGIRSAGSIRCSARSLRSSRPNSLSLSSPFTTRRANSRYGSFPATRPTA